MKLICILALTDSVYCSVLLTPLHWDLWVEHRENTCTAARLSTMSQLCPPDRRALKEQPVTMVEHLLLLSFPCGLTYLLAVKNSALHNEVHWPLEGEICMSCLTLDPAITKLLSFWRSTLNGIYIMVARLAGIMSALVLVTRKYFVHLPMILYGILPIVATINVYFLPETFNLPFIDDIKDMEKRWDLVLVHFHGKEGSGFKVIR